MSLKRFLLTSTSLCLLAFAPIPAMAQDAALVAAYNAYIEAQSGSDSDAKTAAEAALMAECERLGLSDLEQCIAVATGAATLEQPAPAAEPAPPAAEPAPPAQEPAPPPAEQPAPAAEQPAPTEQPAPPAAEQPAPAEPAPAEPAAAPSEPASPASDPALLAAYQAYVSASSGTDADAKAAAEAAFLVECNRLGIASLDECLALMGGAPATTPPAGQPAQPLEQVEGQQNPDAPAAQVLDSAKDSSQQGNQAPAPQPAAETAPPPASDADAQAAPPPPAQEVTATVEVQGQPIDQLPAAVQPTGQKVESAADDRLIINIGINIDIFTPYGDRDRVGYDGQVSYEQLENGRYKQIVIRPDGTRIITVWNRYGEIIRRVKELPDGTRIILIFYPDDDRSDGDWRDPGDDLPPFYLPIPVDQYVLYSDRADEDQIELFLEEPPLEQARRVYTVDEVKRSARIRDTIRRVEIGDLTFETGSAQLGRDQVGSLGKVAEAMKKLLARNPGEVFLIEGHTDAVGSDESNLVLSDERAETIANLLTEFYDVPPENLTTQGYGERYLKVQTDGEERANRRVTVRRITTLVSSSAS